MNDFTFPCPLCGHDRTVQLGGADDAALYLCLGCDEEFDSPGL